LSRTITSNRRIESNKRNASRSTGPRTPGGKLRSAGNARRHGLATSIENDPEARGGIECLAAILTEGSGEFEHVDQSRVLAECHFDLRRIRAARFDVFFTMVELENASSKDFENALSAMNKISRYERRASSKRRSALRAILAERTQPSELSG
jgi:hypothetical protein